MTKNRKVLVICLDGATFDLISPWVKKGFLPNIRTLLKKGAYGRLKSTLPMSTPPAWAAFSTGNSPGNNGIFDFFYMDRNSAEHKYYNREMIKSEVLWERLNKFGKRVGSLFLPSTFPVRQINGFMVSGLSTPDYRDKKACYPEDFLEKYKVNTSLLSKYIDCEIFAGNYGKLYKNVMERLKEKAKLALDSIEKEDWDLFIVHFQETDIISHGMWFLMDRQLPIFDGIGPKKFSNSILKIYQKCDEIIGSILKKLNKKELNIILMSDHGFGPMKKTVNINNWLVEKGLLKFQELSLDKIISNISYKIILKLNLSIFKCVICKLEKLLNVMYKQCPKSLEIIINLSTMRIIKSLPRRLSRRILPFYFSLIDWNCTKVYSVGGSGGIFINLAGNNPHGIVKRKDYEMLRSYVNKGLEGLKDHQGNKLISKIYKKEEIYHGKYLDYAPDLLPFDDKGTYFSYVYDLDGEVISDHQVTTTGNHRRNGIFIINGQSIEQEKELKGVEIIDVAPTIYYLMGIPVPKNIDGKVILDCFKKPHLLKSPVIFEDRLDKETPYEFKGISHDEEEKIKERLTKLGYL